jgi:signal transduction histidine kinase
VEGLPDAKRILLFRLLQAALDRAAQSAGPRRIRVALDSEWHEIRLSVEIDSAGFDGHLRDSTAFREAAGPAGQAGWGLVEIGDRLELLGGSLEIRDQPGGVTRLTAKLPFE